MLIAVWFFALLVAPAAALGALVFVRRRTNFELPVKIGIVAALLTSALFACEGFGLAWAWANLFGIIVLYGGYCFVALSYWRRPVNAFGAILLIPVLTVEVLLLTGVGVIVLLAIVIDPLVPGRTELLSSGDICEITDWGLAVTESGYTVNIFKVRDYLPVIRQKVLSVVVVQTAGDDEVSCSAADAKYRSQ